MVAPMDYRINSIMQKNGWSKADAEKFIARVEKERFAYRHAVMGKNSGDEEFFDITFNRAEFNASMIVDQVMLAICQKKILEGYATKIDFF
jgi:cytidylate kinase